MSSRPSSFAVSIVACAAFAFSVSASASALAADPATAQALFDQGRKLMAQERWAEACPKLEESQRLDPAGGTVLHLALCREHEGRIATAWALYQDALSQAKHDGRKDRAKVAQERIDALAPRLPKLRVRVPPTMRRAEGLSIMRDDVLVGEAQWGEQIPIDPGAHVLSAKASGRKPWTLRLDVPARGQEVLVDVPVLELDTHAEGDAARPDAAAATSGSTSSSSSSLSAHGDEASRGSGQRTAGLVVSGIGVVGLIVGGIFGVVSISKNSDADKECLPPDHTRCTAQGVDAGRSATTAGNVSTSAFIAGGVLVAGGLVLYFTAPSGSAVALAPSASAHGAALGLTARF
jgi:hypothetical protein